MSLPRGSVGSRRFWLPASLWRSRFIRGCSRPCSTTCDGGMMRGHPYLRAYMAGSLLPSWFLLVVLGVFLGSFSKGDMAGLIVFPMAIVPNLWGVWNVLYTLPAIRQRF